MTYLDSKWFPVLAAAVFLAAFGFPSVGDFVSFANADNESSATLTVTGVVDTTINCSSLVLGTTFTPGTNNGTVASTQQCKMTINSNTNTIVTISVNSTQFLNVTVPFGQQNITYSNNSGTQGTCLTSFLAAYYSGNCAGANYTNWVNIAVTANGSAINRPLYFNVTIPSTLPKGTYTGSIYIKFTDTG